MIRTKITYLICLGIALTIAIGCASISSPQGGPVDSLPPRVKNTTPLPYSTNFTGKRITFEFNEYVKLKDQQKLFFISPETDKKPLLSIKGKSVVVDFQDTLLPNQTYKLDFGSSIVDNNEGNKLDGFTFTFSTGDIIDSLVMAGQVIDAYTRDTIVGAFITYYDMERDSTFAQRGLDSTLHKSRAEAVFRSDSTGYFIGDILQDKKYRIYAFLDNNGNQRYEQGTDIIAFNDLIINPIDLPGFSFGYDSTNKRMVIDSLQIVFEVFREDIVKRQNLLGQERSNKVSIKFDFNSQNAEMDSLELEGINLDWLIEDRNPKGDTIIYWIAAPTKEEYLTIPDTIKGRMVYQRQNDSLQFYNQEVKLNLIYKDPEAGAKKAEKAKDKVQSENKSTKKKRGKKEEQMPTPPLSDSLTSSDTTVTEQLFVSDTTTIDSLTQETLTQSDSTQNQEPQKNPFGFKVEASQNLNPEHNIVMTFDYPLRKIDSSLVTLVQSVTEQARGARMGGEKKTKEIRTDVPVKVEQQGLRKVVISADWQYGANYELTIPAGVFEDIIFNSNDTLNSKFAILDPDKYGTLTFNLTANKNKIHSVEENVKTETLSHEAVNDLHSTVTHDSIVVLKTIDEIEVVDDSSANKRVEKEAVTPDSQSSTLDNSTTYVVELLQINGGGVRGAASGSSSGGGSSSGSANANDKLFNQKIIASRKGVKVDDKLSFKFLAPGTYYLRVIEDTNGDGEWTTGDLRNRIPAERSRIYKTGSLRHQFEAKENWELVETINLNELFNRID